MFCCFLFPHFDLGSLCFILYVRYVHDIWHFHVLICSFEFEGAAFMVLHHTITFTIIYNMINA